MSSPKILIPIAILALLAGAYFFTKKDATAEQSNVIKKTLELADFTVKATATGELKAKRSEKIRGPQGLRQANIYQLTISDMVAEGTIVEEGDYVAKLDRSELDTKLKDIQTEIEKIETQLAQSEIDTAIELRGIRDQLINLNFSKKEKQLEVEQSKYEAPMVIQKVQIDLERTARDYNQLLSKYELTKEKSEAQISEINASLKQNNSKRERYAKLGDELTIKAPKNGMVIYHRSWNGKIAAGSQVSVWNPIVAELPDLTDMVSKTFVNEVDISRVKKGQDVKLKVDAFPDKEYTGSVLEVANIGEQLRNYDAKVFEVTVQVNEMDSILRPAMTTSNEIVTDVYNNVLSIPLEALHSDSLSFVYLEKNGRVYKQEVITGVSNNDEIMIDHGVKEGDTYWLSIPDNAQDLKFYPVDEGIKKKIKQKQIAERGKRQAAMEEKLKNMKNEKMSSDDGGGGGGMIIMN
jgi:multidrug efflux pump subunit AcrA (membrane-fusion protein)